MSDDERDAGILADEPRWLADKLLSGIEAA